jgi:hypothetical protein
MMTLMARISRHGIFGGAAAIFCKTRWWRLTSVARRSAAALISGSVLLALGVSPTGSFARMARNTLIRGDNG